MKLMRILKNILGNFCFLIGIIGSSPLIIISYIESLFFGQDTERANSDCNEKLAIIINFKSSGLYEFET